MNNAANSRCNEAGWLGSPLAVNRLPVPATLTNDDVTEQLFQRLAVAFGLSFDEFNIGDIVPPHQTPDVGPPNQRPMPEYISKDQT